MSRQEQFSDRLVYYCDFCGGRKYSALIVPVEQHWCNTAFNADAFYNKVKAQGGEGVIMRTATRCSFLGIGSSITKLFI